MLAGLNLLLDGQHGGLIAHDRHLLLAQAGNGGQLNRFGHADLHGGGQGLGLVFLLHVGQALLRAVGLLLVTGQELSVQLGGVGEQFLVNFKILFSLFVALLSHREVVSADVGNLFFSGGQSLGCKGVGPNAGGSSG